VHLDERVDELLAHAPRSSGESSSAGISLVTTWPSTLSMTKNGAPMTCSSSHDGEHARHAGLALQGADDPRLAQHVVRAGRQRPAWRAAQHDLGVAAGDDERDVRVALADGLASIGPDPMPCSSRNASSGSVTSSGSRSFCAPSCGVRTMSSGAIVCTTDRPRPGASTRPASRASGTRGR
jgi:hypothetical protein